MEHIALGFIRSREDQLKEIAKLNEETINKIFLYINKSYYCQEELDYVGKFKNSDRSPFEFCGRLDPSELQRFFSYFNIYTSFLGVPKKDPNERRKDEVSVLEFFK